MLTIISIEWHDDDVVLCESERLLSGGWSEARCHCAVFGFLAMMVERNNKKKNSIYEEAKGKGNGNERENKKIENIIHIR